MDGRSEPRPGEADFGGFQMQPQENCVDYKLFIIDGPMQSGSSHSTRLESVRQAAMRTALHVTHDYIWHRQPFMLEQRTHKGLHFLHGTTDYGDNVEDEWLIVYLLRELSKSFPNLWIQMFDSDGEFLLIEAANVLPRWISPENDRNRAWIHKGDLFIIPESKETADGQAHALSLPAAVAAIQSEPGLLVHSTLVQEEAFYRLQNYPGKISASLHYSLVTIPRKLASILHDCSRAIAPATEAFYLRDPRALKPLYSPSADLVFPPTDLVTTSVCFTRVLYAQLKSQRIDPPLAWKNVIEAAELGASRGGETEKKYVRLDMGIKVTAGFEMIARDAHDSGNRLVREVALLLQDVEENGASSLPEDGEIQTWPMAKREDDDTWMDINFADFQTELDGKQNGSTSTHGGFRDGNAQANLQKIVSRFEAFLNDEEAGPEGAELDEMDRDNDDDLSSEDAISQDEDADVSFDEERFSRIMREMMGLPANSETQECGQGQRERGDVESDGREEDVEEMQKDMLQMEAELKAELNEYGALAPVPKSTGNIMPEKNKVEEEEGPEDMDREVKIEYNLAMNLLESFKSQGGASGPAGNLLGLMGMPLPRDEDSEDDD